MDINEFAVKTGYAFQQPALLTEALTHPSFAAEQTDTPPHNQRLEFLGDAVLQLTVTVHLYRRYPDLDEGRLTKVRSALTSEPALVQMATAVGIGEFILLGKGERQNGGDTRPSTLADTFEAVLGAMYLDGGLDPARDFILRVLGEAVPEPLELLADENPKGVLQELVQERFAVVPVYRVLRVTGPEHLPEFEVSVTFAGQEFGTARAGCRKDAEKQAARLALRQLQAEPPPAPPTPEPAAPQGAAPDTP